MYPKLTRAIVKTILYADIFDYPLTAVEIWKWLIGFRIKNKELRIKNIKNIREQEGYYFLEGRERLVDLRKEKEKWSQEKLKIAQKIGRLLKFIPTVKLVGITGALAANNAKKEDDIDLFIVTSKDLLWTTRFLSTLLVEITGKRRHPGETSVNNKICLNMFVDENHLAISQKEQDLFSAHEVLQMKLIWDRDDTYQRFMQKNSWAKKYLPNVWYEVIKKLEIKKLRVKNYYFPNYLLTQLLNYLEFFLKKFQLWYMENRRTKEVIKDGIIRFHPHDAREWVMREYKNRKDKYHFN